MRRRRIAIALAMLLCAPVLALRLEAGEQAPAVLLADSAGGPVRYDPPKQGSERSYVSVLVFLDPLQEYSRKVVRELRKMLEGEPEIAARIRPLLIAAVRPSEARRESFRALLPADSAIPRAFDLDLTVRKRYGVIALPTTFVVHPNGEIAAVLPGRSASYRPRLLGAIRDCLGIEVEVEETRDPGQVKAQRRRNLAKRMIQEGRFAEAASQIEVALGYLPDDTELRLLLGELKLDLGEGKAAAELFGKVLAGYPDRREARVGVAKARVLAGEDEEAGKSLRKEILRPHADPAIFYFLGMVTEREGDAAKAATYYRKAYERLRRARGRDYPWR